VAKPGARKAGNSFAFAIEAGEKDRAHEFRSNYHDRQPHHRAVPLTELIPSYLFVPLQHSIHLAFTVGPLLF
jgi:hypothetical protein